jgi:hypothetical protein
MPRSVRVEYPGAFCHGPRKVAVARVIWEKTTAPQSWLAEKLMMGSPANVSHQLRRSDLPKHRRTLHRDLKK